ncbi:lipocalin family protein [Prevotella herbatica]|uniref:Lipocalin family protein n=1 Tax=Prevotella herbatica TaxID=2801997 RepID=A0ABN6EIE8_9BACT|nr:lipocalin family protein [Prevotella herbatica]BCS85657.1 lipocalin family protein [Prevotella herbatica]
MKPDITTVPNLALDKYLGRWYEIARIDNRFERGISNAIAEYSLNPNGTIKVVNSGVDIKTGKVKSAVGKAKMTSVPGLLRVSFFWIFYSDYRVLAVDENYKWALVGGSSSKYLWILSRTPKLLEKEVALVLSEASRRGYDTGRLIYPWK